MDGDESQWPCPWGHLPSWVAWPFNCASANINMVSPTLYIQRPNLSKVILSEHPTQLQFLPCFICPHIKNLSCEYCSGAYSSLNSAPYIHALQKDCSLSLSLNHVLDQPPFLSGVLLALIIGGGAFILGITRKHNNVGPILTCLTSDSVFLCNKIIAQGNKSRQEINCFFRTRP